MSYKVFMHINFQLSVYMGKVSNLEFRVQSKFFSKKIKVKFEETLNHVL